MAMNLDSNDIPNAKWQREKSFNPELRKFSAKWKLPPNQWKSLRFGLLEEG